MECAVLLDKDLDVEDQNSSFYKNMLPEKSDKSQIAAEWLYPFIILQRCKNI